MSNGTIASGRSRASQRILDAAVSVVRESGVDQVTVAALVKLSGVSRGTLYNYFENVEDVLAELWCDKGDAWLAEVLDEGYNGPSDTGVVLAELLGCAQRTPAVREVVRASLERLLKSSVLEGGCKVERDTWVLSGVIGHALCRTVTTDDLATPLLVSVLQTMPVDTKERLGLSEGVWQDFDEVNLPTVSYSSGDQTTDALVKAGIEVIAASGVRAVSLKRVCRVAGVTTGAMDTRFENVQALLDESFESATAAIVSANVTSESVKAGKHPADLNAQLVVASLHAKRRVWRLYRQETHLAALHDPHVAEAVQAASDRANQLVRDAALRAGVAPAAGEAAARLNQVFSLGLGVLHDAGAPIRALDHRVPMHYLYGLLST